MIYLVNTMSWYPCPSKGIDLAAAGRRTQLNLFLSQQHWGGPGGCS